MRAGGAGIPAFYTRTGYGTQVGNGGFPIKLNKDGTTAIASKPKEVRTFDGHDYIMETALKADYALVKGHIADEAGNVVFNKSAYNFNREAAICGKICIVEVEEIVKNGDIPPEHVHLPHVYVQRLLKGKGYEKRIERRTIATPDGKIDFPGSPEAKAKRETIARRAALEIADGMYINLGIGIPTLTTNYIDPKARVTF